MARSSSRGTAASRAGVGKRRRSAIPLGAVPARLDGSWTPALRSAPAAGLTPYAATSRASNRREVRSVTCWPRTVMTTASNGDWNRLIRSPGRPRTCSAKNGSAPRCRSIADVSVSRSNQCRTRAAISSFTPASRVPVVTVAPVSSRLTVIACGSAWTSTHRVIVAEAPSSRCRPSTAWTASEVRAASRSKGPLASSRICAWAIMPARRRRCRAGASPRGGCRRSRSPP